MKYIYRIENQKQQGCYRNLPYSTKKALNIIMQNKKWDSNDECHPLPKYDYGIERTPFKHEICGFKSLQQAYNWFPKYKIQRLKRLGFELKKIKVQKITATGQYQILAIR
ncbi:MAG: hypothetical protein ACTSXT_13305 [Candidatus Helarchaeota archaeon]